MLAKHVHLGKDGIKLERKQWSVLRADLSQHQFKLSTAGEEPAFKNAVLKLADYMRKQHWKHSSLNKAQD